MIASNSATPRTAAAGAKMMLRNEQDEQGDKSTDQVSPDGAQTSRFSLAGVAGWFGQAKFWVIVCILVLVGSLVARFLVVGTQGMADLFAFTNPVTPKGDFATILAPLIAVAIALERTIEQAFSWFENTSRAAAKVVNKTGGLVEWTQVQYKNAYDAVAALTDRVSKANDPNESNTLVLQLEAAKARLINAEEWLGGWIKSPEYVAKKRALSILAGLTIGVCLAVWGDLGMMRYLGLNTPRIMDMLVTGLIIGAGPGPMHSLIGILQGGKDALDKLASTGQGSEAKSSAQNLIDIVDRAGSQAGATR